jgi:hypothetical protein
MRGFIGLLMALLVAGGIWFYYAKQMPSSDPGTAPTQSINLTGVRMDLLHIAEAERAYVASSGRCGRLDELSSSGTMNLARTEREGYSYQVQCGEGSEFSVIARHDAAAPGSPIRYPILAIDQNMRIDEVR